MKRRSIIVLTSSLVLLIALFLIFGGYGLIQNSMTGKSTAKIMQPSFEGCEEYCGECFDIGGGKDYCCNEDPGCGECPACFGVCYDELDLCSEGGEYLEECCDDYPQLFSECEECGGGDTTPTKYWKYNSYNYIGDTASGDYIASIDSNSDSLYTLSKEGSFGWYKEYINGEKIAVGDTNNDSIDEIIAAYENGFCEGVTSCSDVCSDMWCCNGYSECNFNGQCLGTPDCSSLDEGSCYSYSPFCEWFDDSCRLVSSCESCGDDYDCCSNLGCSFEGACEGDINCEEYSSSGCPSGCLQEGGYGIVSFSENGDYLWHYNFQTYATEIRLSDINNDSIKEVVASDNSEGGGMMYAFDSSGNQILADLHRAVYFATGDLNNDNINDFAAINDFESTVFAFDEFNKQELWDKSIPGTSIEIANIDEDNANEVIIGGGEEKCLQNTNDPPECSTYDEITCLAYPYWSVGCDWTEENCVMKQVNCSEYDWTSQWDCEDSRSDGWDDYLCEWRQNYGIFAYKNDGTLKWFYSTEDKEVYDIAIGDINNDSINEIAALTYKYDFMMNSELYQIILIDGNGSLLWEKDFEEGLGVGSLKTLDQIHTMAGFPSDFELIAIADLDNDLYNEVIFGISDKVYAYDKDGNETWDFDPHNEDYSECEYGGGCYDYYCGDNYPQCEDACCGDGYVTDIEVADANKDGIDDIIASIGTRIFAIGNGEILDLDNDGIADFEDNCLEDYNPDQSDNDEDDIGDACEVIIFDENFFIPSIPENESVSSGIIDLADNGVPESIIEKTGVLGYEYVITTNGSTSEVNIAIEIFVEPPADTTDLSEVSGAASGFYYTINVSDESWYENVTTVQLKIYYNFSNLNLSSEVPEDSLRPIRYTNGSWVKLDCSELGGCEAVLSDGTVLYAAGVDTINSYVWANLSRFSLYGIGGYAPAQQATGGRRSHANESIIPINESGQKIAPVIPESPQQPAPAEKPSEEKITAPIEEKAKNYTAFISVIITLAVIAAVLIKIAAVKIKAVKKKKRIEEIRKEYTSLFDGISQSE